MKKQKRLTAPFIISLFLHLIFAVLVVITIRQGIVEDDAINVEWIELFPSARKLPRNVRLQPIQAPREVQDGQPQELPLRTVAPVGTPLAVDLSQKREPLPLNEAPTVILNKGLSVETDLVPTHSATMYPGTPTVGGGLAAAQKGLSRGAPLRRRKNEGTAVRTGFVADQNGKIQDVPLDAKPILVPEDRLGAILEGEGTEIRGHIRLIRLKHSLSDWWQDPTAIPSFAKWLADNTNLRADMKYAGGSLRADRLTHP